MSRVQRSLRKRLACLLLAGAVLLGLVPAVELGGTAAAASYADSYVQQMVDWGFMRGDIDGSLRPNDPITRAEFVTIVNRSFGYEAMGGHPFTDVNVRDWYNDDVDIAYTERYINGTSATTFSPGESITREEAAVILTRNMMLQPTVGEDTSFSDSRELDEWSRDYVATAARYQLLTGYTDGSFRPKNPITRGEAAILLTRAIGTPVQEAGVHELGYTWGNVTITESGATLRNTVVGGNLYITAGVDLGSVTLENVRVLGEIVISGGGVSEGGDDSIVLRNVDAPTLIVDNLRNQQVSLRVEGNGVIDNASVRTDAFVTDNTQAGYGLSHIELAGEEEDMSLHLSGNVKEVVNKTPGSALSVDSGKVDTITVDETATDSTLSIAAGAEVGHVNLDVATEVTGTGDIANLTVNAPGSTVSMLPDQITIRPGVTANIAGETMDSTAAAESSADPRLLSGYPSVTDLAPNTATAQFSANKRGTVHWALTSVTDGSATVDELLNPPAYTNKIVQNGTVSLSGSGEVSTAALTGLTSDGSYYLAAVLVDARGEQSPMKVISFTTPDNSVPAFGDGYPYLSEITNISAQVTGMATKTCRLYWAVLPAGAAAPTANDFKANAVSGNLGFGTLDVTKNVEFTFDANNVPLEELEDYVVYLWLTDVDGGQSSRVVNLPFTTVDRTPPVFNTQATVIDVQRNSVGLRANLNENGTLYWVVVPQGEEYPKPVTGQTDPVTLDSMAAKMQVANGMNADFKGSVRMTANRDTNFTVTGLQPETAYDLYYVAQDEAGNYSASVIMITIHTLDPNAPTVEQEFTDPSDTENRPYPDTGIRLVFSEEVQYSPENTTLMTYYNRVTQNSGEEQEDAREILASVLHNSIKLFVNNGGRAEEVAVADSTTTKTGDNADEWVIDYRYAQILQEEGGKTVVYFPTTGGDDSALNLASGSTYYFQIQSNSIADTSQDKNIMLRQDLTPFTTVFATVNLYRGNINRIESYYKPGEETVTRPDEPITVDISWQLDPISTRNVSDSIDWDMLIWSDTSVSFNLFCREIVGTTTGPWRLLETEVESITVPDGTTGYEGASLTGDILQQGETPDFDQLNTLQEDITYEYAISFTRVAGLSERGTWSQLVNMRINVIAGSDGELGVMAGNVTEECWDQQINSGRITNIGNPSEFDLRRQFTDDIAPSFSGQYPQFDVGDSAVQMYLRLDRPGTVYYVVAPMGYVDTKGENNLDYDVYNNWKTIPCPVIDLSGQKEPEAGTSTPDLTDPDYLQIVNASTNFRIDEIKYGSITCGTSVETVLVDDLNKLTDYTVYFVLQGTSQTYSDVYAYRFTTEDVAKPVLTLNNFSPSVNFQSDSTADVSYALITSNQVPTVMQTSNGFDNYISPDMQDRWDELTAAASEGVSAGAYASEDRTVLWALCNTYGTEGYSIFDEFADNTIRGIVANLVSGTVTGGADLTPGQLSLNQANNYQQIKDFTDDMTGGTIYYCLATAISPLGSERSFAGVAGIQIRDTTPPVLQHVNTVARETSPKLYSGSVTFVFDEPVYQLVVSSTGVDQKPMEVWQTQYSMSDADRQIAVNLPDIIATSATGKFSCENNNERSPSRMLTLTFEDIPLYTTIGLFSNSFICDANSNSTRVGLSFILLDGVDLGVIQNGTGFVQQENTSN